MKSKKNKKLIQILVYKKDDSTRCYEVLSDREANVEAFMKDGYKVTNLTHSESGAGNPPYSHWSGRYTFILEKYINV